MNRSCVGPTGMPKRRFNTRRDAKNHIRFLEHKGANVGTIQAYRCPECDWFHVGHYPTNERTREQMREAHRTHKHDGDDLEHHREAS